MSILGLIHVLVRSCTLYTCMPEIELPRASAANQQTWCLCVCSLVVADARLSSMPLPTPTRTCARYARMHANAHRGHVNMLHTWQYPGICHLHGLWTWITTLPFSAQLPDMTAFHHCALALRVVLLVCPSATTFYASACLCSCWIGMATFAHVSTCELVNCCRVRASTSRNQCTQARCPMLLAVTHACVLVLAVYVQYLVQEGADVNGQCRSGVSSSES